MKCIPEHWSRNSFLYFVIYQQASVALVCWWVMQDFVELGNLDLKKLLNLSIT